jgi:beta-lactamase regulating signal transducer with metallopeptidase domain
MNTISIAAAWTAAGWTMLHMIWIGAAVGLAAAIVRRLLRPARPEVRHGAAVILLLGLTVAPAFLFAWLYRPETAADPPIAAASRGVATNGPATVIAATPPALDLSRPDDEAPAAPAPAPLSARLEPMVVYLPGVWLSGSLATLALVATGLVGVERLRRSSRPLEADAIAGRCRALADSLGIARRVGVAICDRIAGPVLVGVFRPMILLPAAALGAWSVEQLEMALLHELAHIRRHDNLITLLQRLAESLLFFHPVAWWLSGWVGLERELCCDRLVVERTGRPRAYARMLAGLAGVGPAQQSMALAMARRPLTTRIRRILDMEDRSMKMTLNEGLGLLAAAIAGTAMTLAAHARPPEPIPADAARRALERLARRIVAMPDDFGDRKNVRELELYDGKGLALIEVAQAQLKLGDRAAALATLRLLDGLPEHAPPKPGAKPDLRSWERFSALAESVEVRRDAGDLAGARAAVEQADRQLEALDHGAVRGAIERVGKELDAALAKKDEGLHRVNDEESAFIAEASLFVIEEYIKLGDMARARTLIRRAHETIGPPRGSMPTLMNSVLGGLLVTAGDPAGGRDLIEQARRAALALPDPQSRAWVLGAIVKKLCEAGELDRALALVREMTPSAQRKAIAEILLELSTDDHRGAWFDPAGIAIKIGEPSAKPKDPASARVVLPKIAAAARASGDAKVQARILATVAHLQARAGDVAAALATARSIPDLKRSDFPGPNDGFYDAIKPVTFALIAAAQADAGDRAAAATLDQADALARAVAADDQKLIARIVIAQRNVACGRRDVARAVIAEALALALTQPEPRRSRVLAMLVEAQASADDADGALKTIEAIRAYPGLEKARALSTLARRFEEAGDAKRSDELLRRATAALEFKGPEKPLPGKVLMLEGIGHDTFIDYDLELRPEMTAFHRNLMLQTYHTRRGDVEAAIRDVKAAPAPGRDFALSQLVGNLARNGDLARAMNLAESIESPTARIQAFMTLANVIPDRQARK